MKTEFDPDCFGSIDKEKKASCRDCAYSDECEMYKEPLKQKLAKAAEKGRSDYMYEEHERKTTTMSKLIAYSLTIIILLVVFLNIFSGYEG